MELPDAVAESLLRRWPLARLATVAPDERPHLVPIVFAAVGDELWSPVDGKPKSRRELARVRNVRSRAHVSVLLDAYEADWERLWWLRLDGRAAVVEGRVRAREADVACAVRALRDKYPQYAELPLFRGEPLLLRIQVERRRSWCAGPAALEQASRASRGGAGSP